MPFYASPYPKFDMSPYEKEQLHATAMELLDQARIGFERYIWESRSTIDAKQWALVKEREGISVYHDRRLRVGAANKDMHSLLTVGSLVGTLNEAMYGELNHTTEAMRTNTAYMKDTMMDSAVLETILEPTIEQPFQSMTVRWFVKGVPLLVRLVTKHRDCVFLEATGMAQLSNSETIGYHVMHSLSSPKTPKLPQYERNNMSICTIWYQEDAKRVQVYCTVVVEISEMAFVLPMAIKSIADALLSMDKVIECAQLKKLACLVQSRAASLQRERTSNSPSEGCVVCSSQSRSTRKGVNSCCAICGHTTCKSCRQKREIYMVSPDRQLLALKMRFCLLCITSASLLDPVAVARDEVVVGNGRLRTPSGTLKAQSLSRTISSSSSSTSSEAFFRARAGSVFSSSSSSG